jgi:hypothetical protein
MSQSIEKEASSKVDWFKRVTDTITALVVLGGFVFTISQIWRLQESTDLAAWNDVSHQWIELDKFMVQNPNVRKYMYNDIPLPSDSLAMDRINAAGLYVLDFADNAISTSNYITTKYPHAYSVIRPKEWQTYFAETFFKSKVICDTLKQFSRGFNPETERIGREACQRAGLWTPKSAPIDAHADLPSNRRDAMSGTNGGTLFGFLTGVLTSSAVAAIVTQLFGRSKDRSLGRQKIMEFLTERRQELSKTPDLLATIAFLERETRGDASNPPFKPGKMRELPGFLEPIGVYLEFNPDAFQRAYQVFAKEVGLCANSHYLWLKDDDLQPSQDEHYSTSPYWTSFRQFVANTRQNLAEQRLPPVKRVVHRLAGRVLNRLAA